MTQNRAQLIKIWIKKMGFKLAKSHVLSRRAKKINYYTLDNFGVYEEIITKPQGLGSKLPKQEKFISWTPWGIDIEVNSVKDLSNAYDDFLKYNPDVAVN